MASASKTRRSLLCCEMWDDATGHFTIWEYSVFLQMLLGEFREHKCATETKQCQSIEQIGGVLALSTEGKGKYRCFNSNIFL